MATMLDCLSMYCTENTAIMVTMATLPTKEGTNEQTKLILIYIYKDREASRNYKFILIKLSEMFACTQQTSTDLNETYSKVTSVG
jgi:hypothetical protein